MILLRLDKMNLTIRGIKIIKWRFVMCVLIRRVLYVVRIVGGYRVLIVQKHIYLDLIDRIIIA